MSGNPINANTTLDHAFFGVIFLAQVIIRKHEYMIHENVDEEALQSWHPVLTFYHYSVIYIKCILLWVTRNVFACRGSWIENLHPSQFIYFSNMFFLAQKVRIENSLLEHAHSSLTVWVQCQCLK